MSASTGVRLVVWCHECSTQICGYGFADATRLPTSVRGPWLCLFCAAEAAKTRPDDITQAFTTSPIPPGSVCNFSRVVAVRATDRKE